MLFFLIVDNILHCPHYKMPLASKVPIEAVVAVFVFVMMYQAVVFVV